MADVTNTLLIARGIERIFIASTIPLLLWIGYRLFVLGATGQMTLTAKTEKIQGKIANLSPGCFCFLIAVSLAAYSLSKGADYESKSASSTGETISTTPVGNPPERGTPTNPAKSAEPKPSQTSQAQTHITEMHWSYAGGTPNQLPTSVAIRVALSDFAICRSTTAGADACEKKLKTILKRIPTASELSHIEDLEKPPVSATAAESLRNAREDFLWEGKK